MEDKLVLTEGIILSILFSLGIFIPLYRNPVGQIMSYPKKIREKVESLPQYKDCIKQKEKKHLLIKILSIFIFALVLYIIAYMSNTRTFNQVFRHVFIIFFIVNIYDLIIMDLLIFRNVKKFRIPGTEDMDKEYKECGHHIMGFFCGIGIGIMVAFLAGLYNQVFALL